MSGPNLSANLSGSLSFVDKFGRRARHSENHFIGLNLADELGIFVLKSIYKLAYMYCSQWRTSVPGSAAREY